MSKSPAEELAPCAWRRISNISGECTGLFETQEGIALRTERLEPLYAITDEELRALLRDGQRYRRLAVSGGMATCTYDNPATMCRECWQDGLLIFSYSAMLMMQKGAWPPPGGRLFFGANIGEWNPGRMVGDSNAMLSTAPVASEMFNTPNASYAAGAAAAFNACVKACEDLNAYQEDDPGASFIAAIRKLAAHGASVPTRAGEENEDR